MAIRVLQQGLPDLVDQLGGSAVDPKSLERLATRASLEKLSRLQVAYTNTASDVGKFGQKVDDARVDLPPFGFHPAPHAVFAALKPYVEAGYHQSGHAERHASASKNALVSNLLSPRRSQAVKLTRLLQTDERVRAAFEKKAGMNVIPDGRTDGAISVSTAAMTAPKTGANVSAMNALPSMPSQSQIFDLFHAMDQEIMAEAYRVGLGTTSGNASLSGLNLFGTVLGAGQVSGIVSSTSASGDNSTFNDSVDVSTLNLKRMIDKRDQAINAYRSVFDKYGESAKQLIDALRA